MRPAPFNCRDCALAIIALISSSPQDGLLCGIISFPEIVLVRVRQYSKRDYVVPGELLHQRLAAPFADFGGRPEKTRDKVKGSLQTPPLPLKTVDTARAVG